MDLESKIKDILSQKLEDGTVEKLVAEHVEKGISKALEELFGAWGNATKAIKAQIESVIMPYLESYDYSRYITKLDSVLVDILKITTEENRTILANFKELMSYKSVKEINVTDLFELWMDYVSKNVNTDGLYVNIEDTVSYESVCVTFELIESESRSRRSFRYGKLVFECKHDEDMNFEIPLSRYNSTHEDRWNIRYERIPDIHSLKNVNQFDILLMNLRQCGATLIIDESSGENEVYPKAEPEASFS
jgi:hypothetical protein